ncbi:MAG TPA: Ig-like domain-containing protein [bacterium]|nr:Ig-like domain-containing protein [bacterium]
MWISPNNKLICKPNNYYCLVVFFCCFIFYFLFFTHGASAAYTAEYWNVDLGEAPSFPEGSADYTTSIENIDFSWGESSPATGTINANGFVARYTQTINFQAGTYYLETESDDGIRVYLDNVIIDDLNNWIDQGTTAYHATQNISAGNHTIKVEYYENSGGAVVRFAYTKLTPSVSAYFPSDNASGVTTTADLILTFDEAVDAKTGNITIYKASDDSIFEQIPVTASTNITGSGTASIAINATSTLADLTSYYVKIDTAAFEDTSGNSYAGITDTTTWNFTTSDCTNPSVSNFFPADGAITATTTANLILTFDEAVDVKTGNLVIYKSSDDSVFETIAVTSGNVTGSGTASLMINPTFDFDYETSYYVKIDASAFDDTSGNSYAGITDTTTWNFTIENPPPCPTVEHAATYNHYPTCGVAACESGYTLSNGACGRTPTGGGYIVPSSIGNGQADSAIPMHESKNLGLIDGAGFNILGYLDSVANFSALTSQNKIITEHSLKIISLDTLTKKIKVLIQSDPLTLELGVGETKNIDLDNDQVSDIALTYNELLINRVDLTIEQLDLHSQSKVPYLENTLIKTKDRPVVFVIQDGKKCPFYNAQAFLSHGYNWKDIKVVEDLSEISDGEIIYVKESLKNNYQFTRDLKIGLMGEDVKELQKYLNANGFVLAADGSGSPDKETDKFGSLTRNALIKFQQANDISPAVGYFGPVTRKFVNNK